MRNQVPILMSSENTSLLADDESIETGGDQRKGLTADYEDAIAETGFGRFNWLLLGACGWANAGDAVEVLCLAFLLPAAECDLQLSSQRKGWLTSSLFIGMMVGGYAWGCLGDRYGRRSLLAISLLFNGTFGVVSCFAHEYWLFLALRFLSGVGVGGNVPLVWSYFAEFQTRGRRGAMLSGLACFWMVGNIITAGLAWAIIPAVDVFPSTNYFNSWRVFTAVTALPVLSAAALISQLPESPKYYMERGDEQNALSVLRKVHKINCGEYAFYPVTGLIVSKDTNKISMRPYSTRSLTGCVKRFLSSIYESFGQVEALLAPSVRRATLTMMVVNFTLSFGYYGLWMWFPELYSRLDSLASQGQTEISICSDQIVQNSTSSRSTLANCSNSPSTKELVGNNMYLDQLILALSNLPGNVVATACMDRAGRRPLLSVSMLLCAGSVFFIYYVETRAHNLALSCVFGGLSVITWNTLDVLGTELFPTLLRSTALGVCLVAARVGAVAGNLVFGQLIDTSCLVPLMMVAGLLAGGGLVGGLVLPNTTRVSLL